MKARTIALVLVLLLVAAGAGFWVARDDAPAPSTAPAAGNGPTPVDLPDPEVDLLAPELSAAVSEPLEDSYYPRVGDPGVDSLHYGLDLTWLPDTKKMEGIATVTFRATADADTFQLDLGEPLMVSAVAVDGADVEFEHPGKDLVVAAPVEADQRYVVQVAYSGTPEPVPAPTTRTDFSTSGWTITPTNEVWTMQEPFGAYSWYPVNDQPSDKALYDFTITVKSPWTGVANGTMTSRDEVDGNTVTTFHLAEPAASYLITLAIGDYDLRESSTDRGVPLSYWALRSQKGAFPDLRYAKPAIAWLEGKLGPYPFSSAGILLTDSMSGMETQTLVTLGDTPYARSREVIVHEMAHQWYGDLVTPTDWRDVWMNEGMAMYLQFVYRAETTGPRLEKVMQEVATYDQSLRDEAGPPGNYDAGAFGESNIYYCPALMWHQLRRRVGDQVFWRLVRDWPREHAYGNATRQEWFDWVEGQTGLELTNFFNAWIMGDTTPPGV